MKNNLRNLRDARRYTLREVSDKTGVNYASLSRLENLNQDFTGEQLKTFADFFKVSIDYLLAREPIPHPTTIVKNIDLNYQSIKEYMFRAPKEELIKKINAKDSARLLHTFQFDTYFDTQFERQNEKTALFRAVLFYI
jgi:transcriptional regulator with XRE-family HTH domain